MKLNDLITYREVEDSVIIITPWDNAMHILEDTGKFIFENMLKGVDEERMLDMIIEEYDVSKDEAKKDLNEFINSLKFKKIFIEEDEWNF